MAEVGCRASPASCARPSTSASDADHLLVLAMISALDTRGCEVQVRDHAAATRDDARQIFS